jgi:hypothetical protein
MHIIKLGKGVEGKPYVDAHPSLYPKGTLVDSWIGSLANEPSPEEGEPNCSLVCMDSYHQQQLKKHSGWPVSCYTYCLMTTRDIAVGEALTTDYDDGRTVIQKGYKTWMDERNAKLPKKRKEITYFMNNPGIVAINESRLLKKARVVKKLSQLKRKT